MDGRLFFIAMVIGVLILAWIGAGVLWRAAEMAEIVAPLDEASFAELSVVAVGTGGTLENPERRGPSTAVALGRTVVLVDAGRGLAEGLRAAKIPLDQPEIVLLTNLLPENTMGLDDLLYTGWLVPRDRPLRVVGPIGTNAFIEGLTAAYASGSVALREAYDLPPAGGWIEVLEAGDGWSESLDALRLEARALPDGPLPTLAWRISDDAARVVISGSGWGRDVLTSFAGGADVLVHEAAYLPTVAELEGTGAEVTDPARIELERKHHTSTEAVGKLASEAQVDRLVLVRLRPPPFFDLQVRSLVANDFPGTIVVPSDGEVVFP